MIDKSERPVLVTVPKLSRPGGVSSLFNILKLDSLDRVSYFEIHGSSGRGKVVRIFDLIFVYIRFCLKLPKFKIVHVNPSLDLKSFYRDAIFIFLAKLFSRGVLVYWHGWDDRLAREVSLDKRKYKLFSKTYRRADKHVVLGSCFANQLKQLGVTSDIIVESNAASDEYLKEMILSPKEVPSPNEPVTVLFIARIEKAKGIFIAIDAVSQLSSKYNIKLMIAGGGSALSEVKAYLEEKKLNNIELVGYLNGFAKHSAFLKADLLLFPTFHNEGMPISIIEAMLYGIPIVTRPVGGIPDWVENEKNGLLTNSLDPAQFSYLVQTLVQNPTRFSNMSNNNLTKAKTLFTPKAVTMRLLGYYDSIS